MQTNSDLIMHYHSTFKVKLEEKGFTQKLGNNVCITSSKFKEVLQILLPSYYVVMNELLCPSVASPILLLPRHKTAIKTVIKTILFFWFSLLSLSCALESVLK